MSEESYVPELGQMAFGQPWQEIKAPDELVNALWLLAEDIRESGVLKDIEYSTRSLSGRGRSLHQPVPMENSGARYECETFKAHAYSWGDDEEQEWNFAWRDLRVSWYKYLGRGTTVNRKIGSPEIAEMLRECRTALGVQV